MEQEANARNIVFGLKDRFKPEAAGNFTGIFHLQISGERGGDFTIQVENQTCTIMEGLEGEPDCLIKTKDKTYEEVETGKANANMAFMMGKIKVSDIGAMLDFINLFERLNKDQDE